MCHADSVPVYHRQLQEAQTQTVPAHIFNDRSFLSLVDETHGVIESPDFVRLLAECLDQLVNVLFRGLMRSVFAKSAPPERMNGSEGELVMRIGGAMVEAGVTRSSRTVLYSFLVSVQ